MNTTSNPTRTSTSTPIPSRRRRAVLAGTALTAVLVALLGVGTQASALQPTDDDDWPGPIQNIDELLGGGDDDGGPVLTIPNGSIEAIPNVTIPVGPVDDDGPVLTIPNGSLPSIPNVTIPQGDDPPAQDPPAQDPPAQDPPADDPPAEDPPADDPPAQDPPVEQAPGQTPEVSQAPATTAAAPASVPVAPFLTITAATIDCAGLVHLTYETGADPAPAPEAEHVVMVSPVSDSSAVTSYRLGGRAVAGTFTIDLQGPAAEPYQVLVVADFEPDNADGIVLVDEAVTVVPTDCAAG